MPQKDCIFCKIVKGEVPSTKEYEDEEIVVFHDIHPKAPFHLLIVPKEHIGEFVELEDLARPASLGEAGGIWTKMSQVAYDLVKKHGLTSKGYRLVSNGGGAALINHLHLHLLGDIAHTREI